MTRSDTDVSLPLRRPRALIFDVGGVLLTTSVTVMSDAARASGLRIDGAVLSRGLRAAVRDGQLTDLRHLGLNQMLASWARHAGIGVDDAAHVWTELGRRLERGQDYLASVPHEAADTLSALRRLGARLAILSNSDGRTVERLRAQSLAHHFELVADSALTGRRKPDPRAYEDVASRMRVPLSTCWYVTDMPHDVLEGASGLGLGAAVLVDPDGLFPRTGGLTVTPSLAGLVDLIRGCPVGWPGGVAPPGRVGAAHCCAAPQGFGKVPDCLVHGLVMPSKGQDLGGVAGVVA